MGFFNGFLPCGIGGFPLSRALKSFDDGKVEEGGVSIGEPLMVTIGDILDALKVLRVAEALPASHGIFADITGEDREVFAFGNNPVVPVGEKEV